MEENNYKLFITEEKELKGKIVLREKISDLKFESIKNIFNMYQPKNGKKDLRMIVTKKGKIRREVVFDEKMSEEQFVYIIDYFRNYEEKEAIELSKVRIK